MLAVTAGDGACGENSTQPTACVSQVVFGVPDTGAGGHHLHVPDFGSAFITETVLASPTDSCGIDIVCEGELVLGLQPAVIFSFEFR